jgi:hypothetical protein
VLEELGGDVLVGGILLGQLERHGEHGGAEERHPRGAIGLVQVAAGGQGLGAIEDADVVQPEKAPGEEVSPVYVLAVDPPGEVEQQLVEHAREEEPVPLPL